VPPPPEDAPWLLEDLVSYANVSDEDPLIRVAIVHGQFELIHPFTDGNGRVGRLLIPLLLVKAGVVSRPIPSISAFLEAHRAEYYRKLQGLSREADWTGWSVFFLQALEKQSKSDAERAAEIIDLRERLSGALSQEYGGMSPVAILDAAFGRPVFTVADLVEATGIPERTVRRILAFMVGEGILTEIGAGAGRRPAVYCFEQLLLILAGHRRG
jgi:Fic family protein